VSGLRWYHSFPDLNIKGVLDSEHIPFVSQAIPEDLSGKTVLDLAAFDGAYSFLAAKRGAKVVLACDIGAGEEITFNQTLLDTYTKFEFLRAETKLGNVHFVPLSALDIDKLQMKFDIVFCFGLYYHVENPLELFKKCYELTKEMLILEGEIFLWNNEPPNICAFYSGGEDKYHDDKTNYFVPTVDCLLRMLMRVGFKSPEVVGLRGTRVLIKVVKT
jgi:tRNA (mo5U34)-methyltransferase